MSHSCLKNISEKRLRPQKQFSYPSDLSDPQWGVVETFLCVTISSGRRRSTNPRDVVDAINYRWSTGCTWRMLPHDFPPWETVYTYFHKWQHDGTLRLLREALIQRKPRCSDKKQAVKRSPEMTRSSKKPFSEKPLSGQQPLPGQQSSGESNEWKSNPAIGHPLKQRFVQHRSIEGRLSDER